MEKSFSVAIRPKGLNKFYTYLLSAGTLVLLGLLALTSGAHDRSSKENLFNSVLNETLGFQKIFVLNLRSRTNNRDAFSLAASLTGFQVEYIDGVTDFDAERALPAHPAKGPAHANGDPLKAANYGSWRAHMNAIRAIVEQNLASALIIEDDTDWDIRLKDQLLEFAKGTRLLVQPIKGTEDTFLDPTNPRKSRDDRYVDIDIETSAERTLTPTSSPYGNIDRWDMLWMGHCGSGLPPADRDIPLGRVVIPNDQTVAELQHFHAGYGDRMTTYPNHTRVISHARGTVCNLAYGVSLPGARKFLYDMGVHNMTSSTDTMLRQICDGEQGRTRRSCLTVNPPLFNHHRNGPGHIPFTRNIRWSTMLNLEKLVDGKSDYIDLWQDGMPLPKGV
ncbi:hypothetical protein AC578_7461 [Pseudocercospora eumusae]|uniref:Glycosyltransferase family 25 protein n=1 Tax=Pseudocercospora eumusae TaxID=321146 RepID=A0A139H909_9PEZI|nr:hypothetical protein AC578_7461 [Pseudocercospora eumusae]